MAKKWQKKELESLKSNASSKSLVQLAQELGRDTPDVEAKLRELGLESHVEDTQVSWYEDPVVDQFNKAMELLHGGKWKKAEAGFQKIVDSSDVPEVAEKARLMLRVCEAQGGGHPEVPEDPFLGAVFEKNRGNLEAALELCKKGGRAEKEAHYAYLAASIHALAEDTDEAVAALQTAVQLNPKNRIHAFHDPDFEELLDRPELEQLFEAT